MSTRIGRIERHRVSPARRSRSAQPDERLHGSDSHGRARTDLLFMRHQRNPLARAAARPAFPAKGHRLVTGGDLRGARRVDRLVQEHPAACASQAGGTRCPWDRSGFRDRGEPPARLRGRVRAARYPLARRAADPRARSSPDARPGGGLRPRARREAQGPPPRAIAPRSRRTRNDGVPMRSRARWSFMTERTVVSGPVAGTAGSRGEPRKAVSGPTLPLGSPQSSLRRPSEPVRPEPQPERPARAAAHRRSGHRGRGLGLSEPARPDGGYGAIDPRLLSSVRAVSAIAAASGNETGCRESRMEAFMDSPRDLRARRSGSPDARSAGYSTAAPPISPGGCSRTAAAPPTAFTSTRGARPGRGAGIAPKRPVRSRTT